MEAQGLLFPYLPLEQITAVPAPWPGGFLGHDELGLNFTPEMHMPQASNKATNQITTNKLVHN